MALTLTQQAHQLIRDHFDQRRGEMSLAVDATCGNGHDTLFLLELGFAKVVAFDVQERALRITRERCKEYPAERLSLVEASHCALKNSLNDLELSSLGLNCVVFNLGYLPSGDKAIATKSESTLKSLEQACSLLLSGGLITLLCYPGHPNGVKETADVIYHLTALNASDTFTLTRYNSERASATTPVLFTLKKH